MGKFPEGYKYCGQCHYSLPKRYWKGHLKKHHGVEEEEGSEGHAMRTKKPGRKPIIHICSHGTFNSGASWGGHRRFCKEVDRATEHYKFSPIAQAIRILSPDPMPSKPMDALTPLSASLKQLSEHASKLNLMIEDARKEAEVATRKVYSLQAEEAKLKEKLNELIKAIPNP